MIEQTSDSTVQTLPYKFTAKERDEETGLYYYGARYLDPRTSRWLSTDPALGDYIPQAPVDDEAKEYNKNLPGGGIYNTLSTHLYNYANNNPVKYTDPDGKIPFMVVTGFIGAAVGAGYSIASDIGAGRDVNWGKAGVAAGAGALAGLTLGAVAATAATGTALTAGSATASFSTVTGIGAGGATAAATALPLGTQVVEQFSGILTKPQISAVKRVAEISHNLGSRSTLSGNLLDAGHITKIKDNVVGLQKALTSIQGSLQNKNLTAEARSILVTAEAEAVNLINKATSLLESVK